MYDLLLTFHDIAFLMAMVVSRMLWKFPGGALRAYEESVF